MADVIVAISASTNLSTLSQRTLTPQLKQRIDDKISKKKAEGRHTVYQISESDFKSWNPRL